VGPTVSTHRFLPSSTETQTLPIIERLLTKGQRIDKVGFSPEFLSMMAESVYNPGNK
jgi:hypothetical protein